MEAENQQKQQKQLEELEISLNDTIESLRLIKDTMGRFNKEKDQQALNGHLLEYYSHLQKMAQMTPSFADVNIPQKIIRLCDDNDAPDDFIESVFNEIITENKTTLGRITDISTFRDTLKEQLKDDLDE